MRGKFSEICAKIDIFSSHDIGKKHPWVFTFKRFHAQRRKWKINCSSLYEKSIMESWKYNVRLFLKGNIIQTKLARTVFLFYSNTCCFSFRFSRAYFRATPFFPPLLQITLSGTVLLEQSRNSIRHRWNDLGRCLRWFAVFESNRKLQFGGDTHKWIIFTMTIEITSISF